MNFTEKYQQTPLEDSGYAASRNTYNGRTWIRLHHALGNLQLCLWANPELWPLLDYGDWFGDDKLGQLSQLSPRHEGEAWCLFAFTNAKGDSDAPFRTDGVMIPFQWCNAEKLEAPAHDPRLPEAVRILANKVKAQLQASPKARKYKHAPESFWLWFPDAFENAPIQLLRGDESVTMHDVDSAWGALATGLHLAASEKLSPVEWPFSSLCYDEGNRTITEVGYLKQKLSVVLDFNATRLFVAPIQARKGGTAEQAQNELKAELSERLKQLKEAGQKCTCSAEQKFLEARADIVGERLKILGKLKIVSPRQTRDPVAIVEEMIGNDGSGKGYRLMLSVVSGLMLLLLLLLWNQYGIMTKYYSGYIMEEEIVGINPIPISVMQQIKVSLATFMRESLGFRKVPRIAPPADKCYEFTYKGFEGLFGTPRLSSIVCHEAGSEHCEYRQRQFVPYDVLYGSHACINGIPHGYTKLTEDQVGDRNEYFRFTLCGHDRYGKPIVQEVTTMTHDGETTEYRNGKYLTYTRAFGDYTTRYSLPRGIDPLTEEQIHNRYRHYLFTYRGRTGEGEAIVRELTLCNSYGHLAVSDIPDDVITGLPIITRHPKCEYEYSSSGWLQAIKRYDEHGRLDDTLSFPEEWRNDETIAVTIQKAHPQLYGVFVLSGRIGNIDEEIDRNIKNIKTLKLTYNAEGLLESCRYFRADGSTVAYGNYGENGFRLFHEKERIAEVELLDWESNRLIAPRRISGWRNRYENNLLRKVEIYGNSTPLYRTLEYDAWGNCTELRQYNDVGSLLLDKKSNAAIVKAEYVAGKLAKKSYWETDKKLSAYKKDKEPIWSQCIINEYDDYGMPAEVEFLFNDDKPYIVKAALRHILANKIIHTSQVAYFDAQNQPYFNFHEKFGRIGCKIEFEYDSNGNQTCYRRFGINDKEPNEIIHWNHYGLIVSKDNPLPYEILGYVQENYEYRKQKDGQLVIHRYFGPDGKPSTHKLTNVSMEHIHLDTFNRRRKLVFFDLEGNPCCDKSFGAYSVEYGYDSLGFLNEMSFYGLNQKKIMSSIYGCHRRHWILDRNGNVRVEASFNAADNLIGCKKEMKYDQFGRCIEVLYKDTVGNPASPFDDGEWRIRNEYVKHGKVKTIGFTDGNYQIQQYDEAGNMFLCSLYNSKDTLTKDEYGIAVYKNEFNGKGKVVSRRYYDADSKLTLALDNLVAGIDYEYNSQGNVIKESYIGVDKKLKQNCNHVAVIHYEYNKDNQETKRLFFDENELPTENKYRMGGVKFFYDGKGCKRQERYLGKDGKSVVQDINGVCIVEFEYDEKKREIARYFYNANKVRCLNNDMISGIIYKYDDEDRKTAHYWLGIDNKRCLDINGIGGKELVYDRQGNIIEQRTVDENGNLTPGKNKWAIERTQFDAKGNPISRKLYDKYDTLIPDFIYEPDKYLPGFYIISYSSFVKLAVEKYPEYFTKQNTSRNIEYVAFKMNSHGDVTHMHFLDKDFNLKNGDGCKFEIGVTP